MGILNTVEGFDKLEDARSNLGRTVDRFLNELPLTIGPSDESERNSQNLVEDPETFVGTLKTWCRRNLARPERVLSVTVIDSEVEISRDFPDNVIRQLHARFGNGIIQVGFSSGTIVCFLKGTVSRAVVDDFDWANQLEGLSSELGASVRDNLMLTSAKWPRDASTAISLFDLGTPAMVDVPEFKASGKSRTSTNPESCDPLEYFRKNSSGLFGRLQRRFGKLSLLENILPG